MADTAHSITDKKLEEMEKHGHHYVVTIVRDRYTQGSLSLYVRRSYYQLFHSRQYEKV